VPPLPVLSAKQLVSALQRNGFEWKRRKGSHITLQHPDGRTTVVPDHKTIAKGTLRAILRDAHLEVEDITPGPKRA
jgi:predicted RNA binding protein YcfA (HicA-like mRNA interferase family)